MKNIKGIIFDLDQTLINSLPLHYQAYAQTFKKYGLDLSENHYYQNIGGTCMECMPLFLNGQISPVSFQQLHKEKVSLSLELLSNQTIQTLETAKLLVVFQSQYKMSIASAGTNVFVMKIVEQLNWKKYFDAIITGNDVRNGKPDPEAFLLAADKMELSPEECIVFEDSKAGIEAAKRAGMMHFDVNKTI